MDAYNDQKYATGNKAETYIIHIFNMKDMFFNQPYLFPSVLFTSFFKEPSLSFTAITNKEPSLSFIDKSSQIKRKLAVVQKCNHLVLYKS